MIDLNWEEEPVGDRYNLDWLVSVDDHVIEPPDVWQSRVPTKFRDRAPRLVNDGTSEFWHYEDLRIPTPGIAAVAGKSREHFSPDPVPYSEMRPGCYDPVARLEDMDRAGILASMCFPTFPRFCGQMFHEGEDKDLSLLCVQAYNDWMIDEWCGAAPGRFIPLMIIPLWDPQLAVKEIGRCAEKGARGLCFSENPVRLGLPSVHDRNRYWDPVWAAAEEASIIVCMHQGSASYRQATSDDAPQLVTMAWAIGTMSSGALLDWLFSPVFHRFPGLKIALSEGGIGWIPYYLERAEQILDKQRFWAAEDGHKLDRQGNVVARVSMEIDPLTLDVRQLFRDHVYGCFIDDQAGLALLDIVGGDNVMIETDYPHSDSTWPHSIEYAHKQLEGLDDETKYKLLRGNAERLYRFTPDTPPARTG
jgi:predicted TIM-barrel fold metal-dependent hydrolase